MMIRETKLASTCYGGSIQRHGRGRLQWARGAASLLCRDVEDKDDEGHYYPGFIIITIINIDDHQEIIYSVNMMDG